MLGFKQNLRPCSTRDWKDLVPISPWLSVVLQCRSTCERGRNLNLHNYFVVQVTLHIDLQLVPPLTLSHSPLCSAVFDLSPSPPCFAVVTSRPHHRVSQCLSSRCSLRSLQFLTYHPHRRVCSFDLSPSLPVFTFWPLVVSAGLCSFGPLTLSVGLCSFGRLSIIAGLCSVLDLKGVRKKLWNRGQIEIS